MKFYQPLPFEGFKESVSRTDCEERYLAIKHNYGFFNDKSMIDVGCANGYFLFRFIQDGGLYGYGVETDKEISDFSRNVAIEHNYAVDFSLHFPGKHFDIGLYLDLHGDSKTNYLGKLYHSCDVLFASTSGDGNTRNKPMCDELNNLYKNVTPIYNGYAGREIYRCDK